MKVSELTGAELDYWVAKAEGDDAVIHTDEKGPWCQRIKRFPNGGHSAGHFEPSSKWYEGGPIIEREHIELTCVLIGDEGKVRWEAWLQGTPYLLSDDPCEMCDQHGPTPLIAAMRAYVASKFDEEVGH